VTHEAHPDTDTDPVAIVFPGQGSQAPGMGRLVFEHSEAARRTFEEASDTTGIDLAAVCFETDAEALADTANTQPAVVTTSVAILRAMREKLGDVGARVRPRVFGGHSLGLFSAAVAAEAISFRDSLLVIMERARLMGSFNEERPVGMASILGLDRDTVSQICEDATRSTQDRVDVANLNEATQTVISGDVTALERAMELARELQGKAIRLKIKVSSHTPLHVEQADEFAEVIRDVPFEDPERPIVSNITSEFLINAEAVRREFEAQLRSPVHWADNVQRMTREGVDTFIEVGPGHALSRMVRRMSDRTAVSRDDAREAPIPISVLPALTADPPPSA
jgi:[acyl-carrier-protein] S-malonyltransferase